MPIVLNTSSCLPLILQVILTATLVIVLVTVIIGGGSTVSLLTWLGIPIGLEDEEEDHRALEHGEHSPLTPTTSPRRYRTSSSSGKFLTIIPLNIFQFYLKHHLYLKAGIS